MKKLTVLCIVGLAVLIVANTDSVAGPTENTAAKCSDGRDNDRDGKIDAFDPDCDSFISADRTTYTAGLTTGTFQFAAVDVIPNGKENALIPDPDGDHDFFRPGVPGANNFGVPFLGVCSSLCTIGFDEGDDSCIDGEGEANRLACDDWDAVIESCDHLVDSGLDGTDVPSFTVSGDNFDFQAPGGGLVHIHGIKVFAPNNGPLFMGLNFLLIGDCFDACIDGFLPASGTKTIPLRTVRVTGHTVARGPKGHCNKDGHLLTLDLPNDLVITATPPPP